MISASRPSTLRPFESLRVALTSVEGRQPQGRPEPSRGTTSSGRGELVESRGPQALGWAVTLVVLAATLAGAPACLVLSLNPIYDDDSIGWDQNLLGSWQNADDNTSIDIERGEWKSYRVRYVHPIESGNLTAYLTSIGNQRFLDVMPARGEDRGSFLVPVHGLVKLRVEGDRLELRPLSYDWFSDRLRASHSIVGLRVTLDQKENALIVSPTAGLRSWLRAQSADDKMFGAAAVFTRK
jgi:hypothetical protein